MAGPTTQQLNERLEKQDVLLREFDRAGQVLRARLDAARCDIDRIEAILNRLAEVLSKTREEQAALQAKDAAREKMIDEIKKALEEGDRKQWLLWVAVAAAVLALVGNLVVALVRK